MSEELNRGVRMPSNHTAPNAEAKKRPSLKSIKKLADLKTIITFLAGVVLTLLVILGINILSSADQNSERAIDYETILDLSQYIGDIDSSWSVSTLDPSVSEIKFESGHGFDGRSMVLHFHKIGANDFIFTSPTGETYTYTINIDQNNKIDVYPR